MTAIHDCLLSLTAAGYVSSPEEMRNGWGLIEAYHDTHIMISQVLMVAPYGECDMMTTFLVKYLNARLDKIENLVLYHVRGMNPAHVNWGILNTLPPSHMSAYHLIRGGVFRKDALPFFKSKVIDYLIYVAGLSKSGLKEECRNKRIHIPFFAFKSQLCQTLLHHALQQATAQLQAIENRNVFHEENFAPN